MRAVLLTKPCLASELTVTEVPIPTVKPGWVLVKIKAFGINRSEMFTRQGYSPSVKLPRIIGIECVGEIENPSDSSFQKGEKVISLMGGLGRKYDGSYAEYALIPTQHVYSVNNLDMDWVTLAAIPEMYYTAYASLFENLALRKEDVLFIRGGTSSVGLAALQLAKSIGATVVSTTRDEAKVKLLKQDGADFVLLDNEGLHNQLLSIFPQGVTKILELVGTVTLKSSFKLLQQRGILCMTGILGGEWVLQHFEPMQDMKSGTYFTQFDSEIINEETVQNLLHHFHEYDIQVPIAKVFPLEKINEAHELMESNTANGKIIIINKNA